MHYLKSKSLILATVLCTSIALNAEDKIDENILSQDRLNLFEYNKKENEESSSKLKKDWVNPITLEYSKDYGDKEDQTLIRIDQPIFKSGGIYSAIKYANATYEYNDLDIQLQKKS